MVLALHEAVPPVEAHTDQRSVHSQERIRLFGRWQLHTRFFAGGGVAHREGHGCGRVPALEVAASHQVVQDHPHQVNHAGCEEQFSPVKGRLQSGYQVEHQVSGI